MAQVLGIAIALLVPAVVALGTARPVAASGNLPVLAWGGNVDGEVGDGTTTQRPTPVAADLPADVTAVAAGAEHSLALTAAGSVYAWGANSSGQLGDGTTTQRLTPVAVHLPSGVRVTAISAGNGFSLALTSTGGMYAWGFNDSGELGDGTTTQRPTPVAVHLPSGVRVTAISAGWDHTLALTATGTVLAWGEGSWGQLGVGNQFDSHLPEQVDLPSGVTATAVSAGEVYSLALTSVGGVLGWGDNEQGQLGDGTTTNRLLPVSTKLPGGTVATGISAGALDGIALTQSGLAGIFKAVLDWGDNSNGQLGNGTTGGISDVPVDVNVLFGTSPAAVSGGWKFGMVLTTAGGVETWGIGDVGQLGDGGTADSNVPVGVALPSGVTVNKVAAGVEHGLALEGPPPAPYFPLTPARIADTRPGSGEPYAGQTLGPGQTLNIQVSGAGGVPSGAQAVMLNVTAVNSTAAGFLTLYPKGASLPLASTVNFGAGQVVPNLAEVELGTGGQVSVFNHAGRTDVVIDVEGYVAPGMLNTGGYEPLSPARIADTRPGSGEPYAGQTIGPGQSLTIQVDGVGGMPPPIRVAEAAVLNVTAVNPTTAGFLTVYPAGSTRPLASNLNFVAGQVVANRVTVPLSMPQGQVTIYNYSGDTDVVVDVNGWYTNVVNPPGSGFTPLVPSRIADTRPGSGEPAAGQTLGAGQSLAIQVAGMEGVPGMGSPQSPTAVVANLTVTDTTASSFLTAWPSGVVQPMASDLNWVAGDIRSNLAVLEVGADGRINVFNHFGSVDVVVDVVGWYSKG